MNTYPENMISVVQVELRQDLSVLKNEICIYGNG